MASGDGQPRRHPRPFAPARGTRVAITKLVRLQSIAAEQLELVIGGGNLPPSVIDPTSCTPSNPSGGRIYTQSMGPDHSGPSVSERVEAAYQKAMAPWQTLNSLAGPWASLAGASALKPR
jgi:hypothetical protein